MLLTNYLIPVSLLCVWMAHCYPYGAPSSTCSSMMPSHGHGSMACQSSYVISASQYQYNPTDNIQITVRSVSGSSRMRGFLMAAKDETTQEILGDWTTGDSSVHVISCYGTLTAVTQVSSTARSQYQATWIAPSTASQRNVIIMATIVESYSSFYVGCFSTRLTPQSTPSTNSSSNNFTTALTTTNTATVKSEVDSTTTTQTTGGSVNLNWVYQNGTTTVTIVSNNIENSQWLGIGLSLDDRMGEDHVFVCKRLSDNTIQVERYINPTGTSASTIVGANSNMGGVFSVKRVAIDNGMITCEFTLSNFAVSAGRRRKRSISALSQATSYQILMAMGSLDSTNGLSQHFFADVLTQRIQLSQSGSIDMINIGGSTDSKLILLRAHGIVLVFIWLLFISTGIILARYFKQSWPERKICNKPIWFFTHRFVMILSAVLTLLAFGCIVVYKERTWVDIEISLEFVHSILGVVCVGAAALQPIMSLCRCQPNHPRRNIFNYLHRTVGIGALLVSYATIFLAILFTDSTAVIRKHWRILVAFLVPELIFVLCLEYMERSACKKLVSVAARNTIDPIPMENLNGPGDTSATNDLPQERKVDNERIKKFLLAFHIFISFGFSIVLAYSIKEIR